MLKADYEELKNGTKTLADLKSYFGMVKEIIMYLDWNKVGQ